MKNIVKNLHIKTKISLYYTIFTAIILFILGAVIYVFYIKNIEEHEKNILTIEYENVKSSIIGLSHTKDGLVLEEKIVDNIDNAISLGLLIFVYDKELNEYETSSSVFTEIDKTKLGYFYQTIENQRYLFFSGEHKNIYITVGMNLENNYKNLAILERIFVLAFCLMTVLAMFFSYILSKQSLSALDNLIYDLEKINIKDSHVSSIHKNYANDEIGFLARAFDDFINKIKLGMQREKDFYEDINHELRTPLMVIHSSLELLKTNDTLSHQQNEKYMIIENNLEKITHLLGEITFLNKNNFSSQIEIVAIDMSDFLKNLQDNFLSLAKEKNLFLNLIIESSFRVSINHRILDILIGNILKNAIAYTKSGTIEIVCKKNEVSIKDTGIGIPFEEQEKIWERFYRSDKSRNHAQAGSGLGLSIVKKIIEENKWKIVLESHEGQGSIFTIYFK